MTVLKKLDRELSKQAKLIAGAGGSKGSSSGGDEAPDTLESKAYMALLDLLGEGQIGGIVDNSAKSIFLNDTPLMNTYGTYNFEDVTWGFVDGSQTQSPVGDGFNEVEASYALGLKVETTKPITFTVTDPNADKVRAVMAVPALIQTDKKGNINGSNVQFAFAVSLNNGGYDEIDTAQISGKTRSRFQREYTYELPKTTSSGKKVTMWTFRVTRITPDSTSSSTQNDLYIDNYSVITSTRLSYPNSAMVGLSFDAQQFSGVPNRSYLVDGLLIKVPSNRNPKTREYTGNWDGTFILAPSDNPAWIMYDIITNDRYGLGGFISPAFANPARLYSIGRYCDELIDDGFGGKEPRFTINTSITNRVDAYRLVSDIASVFNGMAFWTGGELGYMADMPTPVSMIYTAANVIDGLFTYSGASRKDIHTVVLVTWNNPERNYEPEIEYVEDAKLIERFGIRKAEVVAFGCTSRAQAHRVGKWLLYTEEHQSKTVSFNVGIDSAFVLPGDVIQIFDADRAGKRHGGRLLSCTAVSAKLDSTVTYEAGSSIMMRLEDGSFQERLIDQIDGKTVTWVTPLDKLPLKHGMWIIKTPSLEPMTARVVSVGQGDKVGELSITAIQHNATKFDSIESGINLDTPVLTTIDSSLITPTKEVSITSEGRVEQGLAIRDMIIAWEQVKGATSYEVQYRKGEGNWFTLPVTKLLSAEVQNISQGDYTAKVVAISPSGARSASTMSIKTTLEGQVTQLPKLAKFTAKPAQFGIDLAWEYAANTSGVSHTEIEIAASEQYAWALLGTYPDPMKAHNVSGLSLSARRWFRARVVDKFGFASEWSDVVVATPDVDASKVLEIIGGKIGIPELSEGIKTDLDGLKTELEANKKAIADEVIARADEITSQVKAETMARTEAISAEAQMRVDGLLLEATNRANAIKTESNARATAIETKAQEITTAINSQIATVQNGITKEISDRQAGDKTVLSELNSFKASTGESLAAITRNVQVVTDAQGATASEVGGLKTTVQNVQDALSSKADSALLEKYSTIAERDKAISESLTKYDASLIISGQNLYYGENPVRLSGQSAQGEWRSSVDRTTAQIYTYLEEKLDLDGVNLNDDTVVSIEVMIPSTSVGEFNFTFGSYRFSGNSYILTPKQNTANYARDRWIKLSAPAGKFLNTSVTSGANVNVVFNMSGTIQAGATLRWRNLMMEKASKATAYSESDKSLQIKIGANATAIQSTNAEVTRVDGELKSQTAKISKLQSDLALTDTKAGNAVENAATAQQTANTAVTANNATANRVDTLESKVSTVENGLKTKVETNTLESYSTIVERDKAIAEGITAFNAALTIGGVNALADSEGERTSTATDKREYLLYERSTYLKDFYNENLNKDVTISFDLKLPTAGRVQVYCANGSFHSFVDTVTVAAGDVNVWKRYSVTVQPVLSTNTASTNSSLEFYGTYGTGRIPTVRKVQLEAGSKATAWSPSPRDVQSALAGNASAIDQTKAEVKLIDGKVVSTTERVGKLESGLTTVEKAVATKADAALLKDIYTKTEADQATVAEINKFGASLKVGSANLITQAKWRAPAFATANAASKYEFVLQDDTTPYTGSWGQFGPWPAADIQEGAEVVFSFKIKAMSGYPLTIGGHTAGVGTQASKVFLDGVVVEGAKYSGGTPIVIPNDDKFHLVVVLLTKNATVGDSIYIQPNRLTNYNQPVHCIVREVMLSVGNAYVEWVAPSELVQNQLNANATAINSTNAEVARVDGVTKVQSTAINKLQSDLATTDTKAGTAIANAAIAQSTANTAVTSTQTNAVRTEKLEASFSAARDSDSLVPDYLMKNADEWKSHYGFDLSSKFVTTTTGKVAPTVYRKTTGLDWNYTKTAVPNTRAYKISMYARRSSDSTGTSFFTSELIRPDGSVLSGQTYTVITIPADENWHQVSLVSDMRAYKDYSFIRFGFALTHGGAGWAEMQGFKIEAVLNSDDIDPSVASKANLDSVQNTLANADKAITSRIDTIDTSIANTNTAVQGQIKNIQDSVTTLSGNTNTKLDQLTSGLETANGAIKTKAEQTSLNQTNTKLDTVSGKVETQASSINTLTSKTSTLVNDLASTDLLMRAMAGGKLVYGDPTFKVGTNNVSVYNNSNNGVVTLTRVPRQPTNPTNSNYELQIVSTGGVSPGLGGFVQSISARPNAVFLMKHIINLPVGYRLVAASNAIGTGGSSNFIGSTEGTGKYETYYRLIKCGDSGSFSSSGHVYVSGSPVPTAANPLTWYVASIEVYDTTDFDDMTPALRDTVATIQSQVNTLTTDTKAVAEKYDSMSAYVTYPQDTVDSDQTTADNTTSAANRWSYYSMIAEGDMASAQAVEQMKAEVGDTMAVWNSEFKLEVERGLASNAEKIDTLTGQLGDSVTKIQSTTSVVDGIKGQYTVKIDNNGVMSGFSLVSEQQQGQVVSTFGIDVNNFYIGAPANGQKLFVVTTETQEKDGVIYPPGTWINSAYIAEASIKLAHIDRAEITSLSALTANIGVLRTAETGARTEIRDNLIEVFDENDIVRVRIGILDKRAS